jgi:hypothetical protein
MSHIAYVSSLGETYHNTPMGNEPLSSSSIDPLGDVLEQRYAKETQGAGSALQLLRCVAT